MDSDITDIWFRSALPLSEIAQRLGLQNLIQESENYWEWVIGTLGDVRLDITRTHTRPATEVESRIFIDPQQQTSFTPELIVTLVDRLLGFSLGAVSCGKWAYRSGNEFDLELAREFRRLHDTEPA